MASQAAIVLRYSDAAWPGQIKQTPMTPHLSIPGLLWCLEEMLCGRKVFDHYWIFCCVQAHQRLGYEYIKCNVRKANKGTLKMHMV